MELKYLPFGVCNGPATFSRLIEQVLEGLAWRICLAYIDDIIISEPHEITLLDYGR